MRLNDLSSHPSQWFGSGPSAEIVISSRVRLARNLAGFKFLSTCSNEDKLAISDLLREALLSIDVPQERSYYSVDTAAALDRDFMVERHLISRHLAHGSGPRGVVIAGQEAFTAMINEEDHLRLQVIKGGLQVQQCWHDISMIDDMLEEKVEYAFSPKYGYLTACPTNVGTGIRVSVMLHLPALKMTGQIEKFFNATRDMDLAVRGLFGEGTEAIGDFYQISNQVTLGLSEIAIVNDFTDTIVPKIVEYELAARNQLLAKEANVLNDKIYRALGILKSAYMISSQEALGLLSHLRMGVNMKRLEGVSIPKINELFLLTQPAHLQLNEGRALDATTRDELRAKILRQHLN
ncbi:MAG: protein arginine kinase [Planctomycetes bacterium GWF2_50_10]|nr:MAG: protein arginine kinase [Planctomycetes bacterium GWF2_50_10]